MCVFFSVLDVQRVGVINGKRGGDPITASIVGIDVTAHGVQEIGNLLGSVSGSKQDDVGRMSTRSVGLSVLDAEAVSPSRTVSNLYVGIPRH